MEETLDETYFAVIRKQIDAEMPGVLKDIRYIAGEIGEKSLTIEAATELTAEQADRINIVIRQAMAAFKRQISQSI